MTTDPWWLEPGETPLWSGRPVVRRYLSKRLCKDFIVGLPVLGIFLVAYFNWADGTFLTIFQIVLGVLGASFLYMSGKTFWIAKRSVYVLTAARALILIGHESQSIWMRDVKTIRVRKSRDEIGDIVFKETLVDGEGPWIREEGFFVIRDVAAVEKLIRGLIERPASAAGTPAMVSNDA